MHVTPADAGGSDDEEEDPDERLGQKAAIPTFPHGVIEVFEYG